ncbi:MAG: archease [Planctomycetota bacterium]|jgi:SHS2 domain-containing protein
MDKGHWEHYSHPADMGVRGFGRTREEAFAQAALAMTAIVVDPARIACRQAVEVVCEDDDDEMLFWHWLSAVLFEMGLRRMVFGRFKVQAIEGGLKATAWGEEVDKGRHEPAVEVKAATFAELKVDRDKDGTWMAQCVVDV